MVKHLRYRCTACGFRGATPLSEEAEANHLKEILADACVAIEAHAQGRKAHMEMAVTIDGLEGHYRTVVNPRDQWGKLKATSGG